MRLIRVHPAPEGWVLDIDGLESTMVFASGAQAEAAARTVGRVAATRGEAMRIEIELRDGSVAERINLDPPRPSHLPSSRRAFAKTLCPG